MAIPGQAPDPAEEGIPPANALLNDPAFAAEVVQPETPAGGPPVPPETPLVPEPTEIEQRLAHAERELVQRTRALVDRQAETTRLKAELQARTPEQAPQAVEEEPLLPPRDERGRYQAALADHPALRDLPRDDDGNVLLDGTYVHPRLAVRLLETEAAERRFDQYIQGQQQAKEAAEVEAQVDSTLEAYGAYVAEIRAKEMPHIPESVRERVDRRLFTEARNLLSEELSKYPDAQQLAQLTDERMKRIAAQVVSDYREEHTSVVEAQLKHNAEHRDTQKAPPIGGTPGTPKPPGPETMTRAQRSAYMDQLARETERALQNPT
jgi:hypothetical protein